MNDGDPFRIADSPVAPRPIGRVVRPIRLRFGALAAWHPLIRERIDLRDFAPSYGGLADLDADAFDAVVPLSQDDQAHVRAQPALRAKALVPSASLVALCNDKSVLDQALARLGFNAMRAGAPGETGPAYPYVAKPRQGDSGIGTVIVRNRDDEARLAAHLARPDLMRQRCIPGRFEFAAHFLMAGGRAALQRTVSHEMAGPDLAKGVEARPLRSRSLPADPHAAVLERVLAALGYEGSACIDYKLEAGAPKIMEINARMGASLLRSINDYLDAYVAALGLAESRAPLARWLVGHRRVWARRARRIWPR